MQSAAVKVYRVMVSAAAVADIDMIELEEARLRAMGFLPRRCFAGQEYFASDDKTLLYDNRRAMIEVGKFNDRASAQALVDRLAAQGQSSWIFEEIVSLARGHLDLTINGQFKATGPELAMLPTASINLKKVEYGAGYAWHGYADRSYSGRLLIRWGACDAVDCILTTSLENVLAGVVPSEISAKAETGALQAQAVAARGEILAKISIRHSGEGFDTCSEQHCQVFAGDTSFTADIRKKIAPTAGHVLLDSRNAILDAVYSANCGGRGEANHYVWTGQPNPALQGVWDHPSPGLSLDLSEEEQAGAFIRSSPKCYCNNPLVEGGNRFRWNKSISPAEWKNIETQAGIGRIKSITDIARGFSGRIYRMTFSGEAGSKTIMKELNIRRLFGGLASSCFVADWKRDAAGFICAGELVGAGFGHGVGMCQTGAQSLAKQGWNYQKILLHYFPGSNLKKIY
jgi:SpoIID/LytB domain protein